MAYHKVTLRGLGPHSDRDGVVRAVASILNVQDVEAKDMVANLPVVLASGTSLSQALTMKQIFSELGAELDVDPPGVNFGNMQRAQEEVQVRKLKKNRIALILVALMTVVAALVIVIGGSWIGMTVHPDFSAREKIADSLASDPRNADLLVKKAALWIGLARQKMMQQNWSGYAEGGDVPYEGKDLLTIPEADTALQALMQAKRIAPEKSEIYYWLGELYLQKGLAPEAVDFAQQAVKLNDKNPTYYNLLGLALLETENVGKAELSFRKAYEVDAAYLPTYRNLGNLLLYHQQDTLQGLEWLYQYLARESGDDRERYLLRKEMFAAAFALFNPSWQEMFPAKVDFSAYDRDRIMLQRANEVERLAKLYLSQGLTDAALPLLTRLNQSKNPSIEARKMLICAYAKLGLWDAVEAHLRAAEPLDLRDPFFPKNLGVMYKYYRINTLKSKDSWDRYEGIGGDSFRALVFRYQPR